MSRDSQIMRPGSGAYAAFVSAALILLSTGLSLAYWPGIMTWDSIRQYGQALSGQFDDWHPPMMEWIWRQLLHLLAGPGLMLALQLGISASGYGLFAGWAISRRRPALAVAIAATSLTPIAVALMGAVLKDSLMTASLLVAAGLLAWRGEGLDLPRRLLSAAFVVFACTLRFNAFLAGGPLLVALLPERLRSTPLRMILATAAATAALLLPMPMANHLVRAQPSGVGLSLVIFDLGGITEHSGESAFPPLPVKDPVGANHRCYTPLRWDLYADWAEERCAVGFEPVRAAFRRQRLSPTLFWARAILSHPAAYAEHRLAHFNINARFLVRGQVDRPVTNRTEENDWSFQVTPNPVLDGVDAMALLSAWTPAGWPIFWMALAGGLLLIVRRLPSRDLVAALALSSLMYGAGYLVVSVSSELRYHLWTMIAALIAACVAAADLPSLDPQIRRRVLLIGASPAAVIVVIGTLWRLMPG